jgi:hypothetical protein
MGRENAVDGITDVLVFHGSTDAPTVDVVETGVGAGTIVDDLSYGEYQGYLELPTADYELSIKDETGANTVAVFLAPLETLSLDGASLVTVASGFLNPDNNSDGPAFGLWVALPAGGPLVELPNVTSVDETSIDEISFNVYPNPARTQVNIDYALTNDADVQVAMYDLTGNMLRVIELGTLREQAHQLTLNISDLQNGLYFVRIQAGNSVVTRRIQVVN